MYILGQNHTVVTHGALKVWSDRGLIHIEDARDNSYETIGLEDFLLRINALNDLVKNSIYDSPYKQDEITKLQRLIEQYIEVAKKAKEQGTPNNPDTWKEAKRRRPRQVYVPNAIDMEL